MESEGKRGLKAGIRISKPPSQPIDNYRTTAINNDQLLRSLYVVKTVRHSELLTPPIQTLLCVSVYLKLQFKFHLGLFQHLDIISLF